MPLRRLEQGLLGTTVLFMVGLVLSQRYLPMNDAPSHIANAVIGAGLRRGDGFFARYYQMQAVPLPYWMAGLCQIALQGILAPLPAFALLVAAYLVLLPLSFLRLCRAAAPSSAAYAAVAALLGFNWSYFYGEINFILGQPFFLLAYAAFLRLFRPDARPRVLAEFLLWALAVYLCHIYALSALCGTMGCYVLLRLLGWRDPADAPRRPWLTRLGAAALLSAAGLFLLAAYLVFFQHGTHANRGAPGFDLSLRKAAHLLLDPLDSPLAAAGAGVRVLLLGLLLVLLAAPVIAALAARREGGRGRWLASIGHPALLVPGLVLLFIAYAGPDHISGADGAIKEAEISTRFTLSGMLLLLAGLCLPAAPRLRAGLLLVMALLAVVKLQDAYRLHRGFDQRARLISAQVLARIPADQRVLPLMDRPAAGMVDYLYHRLGNYVVVERHGYSPHVFAVLGQHALRHRLFGDYRPVDDLQVRPEEWAFYDYVLLQTDRDDPPVPGLRDHAALVNRAAGFALYRIVKP